MAHTCPVYAHGVRYFIKKEAAFFDSLCMITLNIINRFLELQIRPAFAVGAFYILVCLIEIGYFHLIAIPL